MERIQIQTCTVPEQGQLQLKRPIPTNIDTPSYHHHAQQPSWASTIIASLKSLGPIEGPRSSDYTRRPPAPRHSHLFVTMMYVTVMTYSLIITVGPAVLLYALPRAAWCPYPADATLVSLRFSHPTTTTMPSPAPLQEASTRYLASGDGGQKKHKSEEEGGGDPYNNPDYSLDPCRYLRLPYLAGLSLEDCDISLRMLVSVVLGGVIGYERRSADRPAGIRTMALVSLGACFFTISSIMAFKSSTMGWDASRVTAALPSGVGFLGGALIWKGSVVVNDGGRTKHQVHGLTTAASLWLSSALGVGAGGALYAVTIYATVMVLLVLRFGPKLYIQPQSEEQNHDDDDDDVPHKVGPEGEEEEGANPAGQLPADPDDGGNDYDDVRQEPGYSVTLEENPARTEFLRQVADQPVLFTSHFQTERSSTSVRRRKWQDQIPTFGS